MKDILKALILFWIGIFVLIGIFEFTKVPYVYKSNSTNECVKVEPSNSTYSCENLPTKYEVIWVQ